MQRVKTKHKKKAYDKPAKTPKEIVRASNEFLLSVAIRTLVTLEEFDFTKEDVDLFVESYCALAMEITDGRNTIDGSIRDAKELTGIDCKKIIKEVLGE